MTEQINTNRGTSSPEKKENYTNIFVYGSLRKGMGLNAVLTTSKLLGTVKTLPKYTMYDLGAFPCIDKNGTTSITGDVYRVDDDTLSQLDMIEGVPNLYYRDEIETEDIYVDNTGVLYAYYWASNDDVLAKDFIVESGNWLEHRGLVTYELDDVEVDYAYDDRGRVVSREVTISKEVINE